MTLRELLSDFSGSIGAAMTKAPDSYPSWSSWTYETHMEDIRSLWAQISPRLKHNLDEVARIHELLEVMFSAFESGEKEAGRKAAIAIYNMKPEQLR